MATVKPRWTMAFLRELTRTGDARLAAERCGLDYSEVCRRQLRERDFAGLCVAALNMRVRWLELRRRFPDVVQED